MSRTRKRPYQAEDAAVLASVFYYSVRHGGLRDYSAEQVAAWASLPRDLASVHARATDGRLTLVAQIADDALLDYIDLEANGHIDHLLCRPEAIGTGVGAALADAVEQQARAQRMAKLFVEASEAARRLSLRKNFTVLERRDFVLRGVAIHHYFMEKWLSLLFRAQVQFVRLPYEVIEMGVTHCGPLRIAKTGIDGIQQ